MRTFFAGLPSHISPSPTTLPGAINAPAPTKPCFRTTAPSSTIAPMPISTASSIRHACTIALWPMVTSSPITVAKPPSLACGPSWLTWTTLPSWMLVRAPMRMKLTSPRTTVPGQIETSSPSTTSPITLAAGSTYVRAPRVGRMSR